MMPLVTMFKQKISNDKQDRCNYNTQRGTKGGTHVCDWVGMKVIVIELKPICALFNV